MNKDIVASLIFSVGCFVFFWLAVPQYDLILDIRSASASRQTLLDERTELRENVIKLTQQYNTKKADIDKLILFLPKGERYDQILENITATITQSGMQLRSIQGNAETETNKAPYEKVFVKLDIVGNYSSLLIFLKDLEKSLKLYDVTELSISRNNQGQVGTANLFNIGLKLNTYDLR